MPEAGEAAPDAAAQAEARPRFYIIDGHSLAYQAFYALPSSLRTARGEPTNAVYGFVSMLLKLLERAPDYLAVVFDPKGETFRDALYDAYKAQRPEMPDELRTQIPRLFEVLEAFGIPVISVEGFEADDAIGTLAREAARHRLAPRIVSRDRDLLQLVDAESKALLTRRGITELEEWDLERIREAYGLEPPQLVDVKALMGDTSDNIPGVPGIGEKTALQLIQEFADVDGVLANLEQVSGPKRRELLAEHEAQVRMSRTLAAIRTDVPLEVELDACRWQGPDYRRLIPLFRQLAFGSLLDRLEIPADVEQAVQPSLLMEAPPGDAGGIHWVRDSDQLARLREELQEQYGAAPPRARQAPPGGERAPDEPLPARLLAAPLPWQSARAGEGSPERMLWLDVHFVSGEDEPPEPVLLGLGLPDGSAYLVPWAAQGGTGHEPAALLEALAPYFCAETVPLGGSGLKRFYVWLRRQGYQARGLVDDLRLMAYLLDPSEGSYPLSRLAQRYLELDLPTERGLRGSGRRQQGWFEVDEEALGRFVALRLDAMARLARSLATELSAQGLAELYARLELPLAGVLGEMEHVGLGTAPAVLERLGGEFSDQLTEQEAHIHAAAGHPFNVNSTQQLGQVLFEEMELPVIKRTKTGYSTDAEVLETLAAEHDAAIARQVLTYRTLSKLQSTYVEGLAGEIDAATGRIHTRLNQTVAATGRLSSSEPNLQNIPVRLEMGRRLRRLFVAPPGHVLVAADYSQIELRVLAHISGDDRLRQAFQQGEDIHASTAAEVFGTAPEEVTPEQRNRAKAVNFGIVYGISDFGLARNLGVDREEAAAYIEAYFQRYPGVRQYMEIRVQQARDQGFVRTLFGRIRYLPEIDSRTWHRRQFAERTAINTPIQGTAADIIKKAMLRVDRRLAEAGYGAWMVLQVHDELLFETEAGAVPAVAACVRQEMEQAARLSVPLKVDVKFGPNWYELTPLAPGDGERRDAGTA